MPRDPKITPITRHEPRTFYATRMTRTQAGESWDLWSVEDGRRVGFLSVVDDGHVVYALSTVKRGTSHEEVADLVEGFFTPSSTDAHNREIIISDYDEEPEMLESDIRQIVDGADRGSGDDDDGEAPGSLFGTFLSYRGAERGRVLRARGRRRAAGQAADRRRAPGRADRAVGRRARRRCCAPG